MKVSLIIFTLNEIDGMRVIMPQIKKEWYDEMIIVDGGSLDGTIEYAKEHNYPIFVQERKGMGAAFQEVMAKATGDIVILFNPDGNSIPELIPKLIEKMKEGYDMVTASRYYNDAISYDDDRITAFGNWMFTRLANFLFDLKTTDYLAMYRAFRRELPAELGINSNTGSWGTQLLIRATRARKRLAEIPGDEPERIGGVRKMKPLRNGTLELINLVREYFRCQKEKS